MKLFQEIQDNLVFFLTFLAIVVGMALLARLLEKALPAKRKVTPARRISILGMCGAVALVLYMLDFPLLFLAPSMYKLDFSEVPALLCGFFLGPSAAVSCEGIKILLKLLLKGTTTAFVGDLANFAIGCCLVLPAAVTYHLGKSKKTAILGLVLGTVALTVGGSVFNAVYLLPKFAQLYGIPLENIVAMGSAIHPSIQNVSTFVLFAVAPLNLVKGTLVSVLTLLLYKRMEKPLFKLT